MILMKLESSQGKEHIKYIVNNTVKRDKFLENLWVRPLPMTLLN